MSDTQDPRQELRNEISSSIYGMYYYELPNNMQDAKEVVRRAADVSFRYADQRVAEALELHKSEHNCFAKPKPDPYFHNHVCSTCSPDHINPGKGCINCRQTGYDQTPCPNCPGPVSALHQQQTNSQLRREGGK